MTEPQKVTITLTSSQVRAIVIAMCALVFVVAVGKIVSDNNAEERERDQRVEMHRRCFRAALDSRDMTISDCL